MISFSGEDVVGNVGVLPTGSTCDWCRFLNIPPADRAIPAKGLSVNFVLGDTVRLNDL